MGRIPKVLKDGFGKPVAVKGKVRLVPIKKLSAAGEMIVGAWLTRWFNLVLVLVPKALALLV